MIRVCFLLFFSLSVVAQEIELFVYWRPDLEKEAFASSQHLSWEELGLEQKIARRLQEIDGSLRGWSRKEHKKELLPFKQISSFADLGDWIKATCFGKRQEKTHYWMFWGLGSLIKHWAFDRGEKDKMVLFLWEPPVVEKESHDPSLQEAFGTIFTYDDSLVDGKKYRKFHYPVLRPRIDEKVCFEEKKFCTMINSRLSSKHPKELYSEREKTIRFFEKKPGEFDLYGKNWEKRSFVNYRGAIENKLDVLKNYKFAICYENTQKIEGYITEKIFDCFAAGVVPVYWGASNIEKYIPKECFIDRREFLSNEELYDFLKKISKKEYEACLQAQERFLQSKEAQAFSEERFVDDVVQWVIEQNPSSKMGPSFPMGS